MKIEKEASAPAEVRDIPTPPGGGSWRFDEARWEWIDNNPKPVSAEQQNQE